MELSDKEIIKEFNNIDKLLNKSIDELEQEIESLSHLNYSLSCQISSLGLINIQKDLIKITDTIYNLKLSAQNILK